MRRCKVRYIITGFFLIVRFTFAGLELAESGVPRDLSMKRSRKLISLLLIVCTFLFASCASTTITNVWKDEGYQGKAKKIVVIMVARLPDMRNMFEGRFVAELQARGNQAIQSHSIVTFEELPDRELVKSRIKSTGADTVLIARLVDSKTIDAYMPGHVNAVPLYYGTWGTYYAIVSVDYGHTGDLQVSYIETNLYDIETEKLIWSAHSKTERAQGEQQLINKFIDIILKKMSSDNIIQ
jgi:hypothetical protein